MLKYFINIILIIVYEQFIKYRCLVSAKNEYTNQLVHLLFHIFIQ